MRLSSAAGNGLWQMQLGLLGAALVIAVPTRAQEVRDGNYEEVALNFDLRHLGNATRTSEEAAAARGLEVSDQRLTVGVDVAVNRSLGRNTLLLAGNAGYDFYRRNSQLNRERIGLRADVGLNVRACLVDLSAQIDRRQSDLDTITLVDLPGAEALRNAEMLQTYRAEGRCGYAYGLRPSIGYEHSRGDNSNDLREISDFRSNRVFAGLAYNHPVAGKVRLTYEREKVKFPNRAATPLAALAGYRLDEARLQLSRDVGTILTADAMVAYTWLKPDNAAGPAFKGATWRLTGTLKPTSRLQVRATTERSVRPSLGGEALFTRLSFTEGRATYALSERLTLSGGLSVSDRKYRGAQANFGPLLEEDRFRRIFAGMTMRAGRRLQLTLEGGHERRNATGTIYDYDSAYLGLRGRLTL